MTTEQSAQEQSAGGTPPAGGTEEAGARRQPAFVGSATGQPIGTPPQGGQGAQGGTGAAGDGAAAGGDGQGGQGAQGGTGAAGAGGQTTIGHGGAPMPPEAISERVARERKKILRDVWGTDDEGEIARLRQKRKDEEDARAAELEELRRYREADEKKRREQMSELERVREDIAAKERELEEARAENERMRNDGLANKQDAIVERVLGVHVEPKFVTMAKRELAAHFRKLSPEEQTAFDERKLDRWARVFIRDNTELAKKKEPALKPEVKAKPAPRRAPVTTSKEIPGKGAPPPAPTGSDGAVAGKVVQPGQANSMSRAELNSFYEKRYGRKKPW